MVRIPWDDLAKNPRASESLVTLLMLRLRGRAQAVDGSGGDGGRDLFEYAEDGRLVIYEAKSFTGRMNSGRRTQVVRSLTSAARHQPDHWDLLVPIDATPASSNGSNPCARSSRSSGTGWGAAGWIRSSPPIRI
ncbi:hypothetical protein ACFXGT_37515 [Streptomyces sp. NPDC059352]|uniref:hypothetical protein n=1 Tax=Streptomyces sp. NPDC059352 TaxID=3346810 RepID=UPI00369EC4F0